MGEKVTGYDGETIGEFVDYHSADGKYLGTAFVEERGCLNLLFVLWLPIIIMTILSEVTHGN